MRTVSLACLLMTCAGAGAQELTIADLAPEKAFLIVGVDNSSRTIDSYKKTGSYAFFSDPEVQDWFGELLEEPLSEFEGFLESIDAEMSDFSEPTGMLGMAVWMNMPAPDATGNDAMPVQMILSADFGDNANQTHDMIVRAIENGDEDEVLTFDMEKLGDAEVYTITPSEVEIDDDWDDDDDWGDDEWADEFDTGPSMDYEHFFYARHGEVLMLSSSLGDLENALARIEGVGFDSAGETSAYNRLKPAGDDYHAYAVVINEPLYDLADTSEQQMQDDMMGAPPIMPILDAAGLSEVRGASMTVTFDAAKGDTVGEFFVSSPRLRGIMSLVNVPDKPFTAPSFVSADAASVNMFQADIANLFPTIKQIINDLPPELAQGAGMVLQGEGFLQPMLSQLGPEVYVVQSYSRPYSIDSQQVLVGVKAKDTAALNDAIGGLAPMMGLEGRDFQGNQIWSMPDGGGGMLPVGDIAIGIGFGHMFVGTSASIETAMRQAAEGDSGIANEEGFKTAMKSLSNNGLAFTYQNIRETIEYQRWTAKNMDKIIDAQIEEMFGDWGDEAMKQDMRDNLAENMAPLMNMPDASKILDFIGDSVMEYQLVDGGIKGTFILLRASE